MLVTYLPVLVFSIIAIGVGVVPLLLAYLVAPRKDNERKADPYECGFNPIGEARVPFDVKYYLVAILFILFDLETTFLFPWAVQVRELDAVGIWSMVIFLTILTVGFIYEWYQGALEWE